MCMEGGVVCVWWYVYGVLFGACCVWGCYMWVRVLCVCGVLGILCMCGRALYRGVLCLWVVVVCVCSTCGGMGGCV